MLGNVLKVVMGLKMKPKCPKCNGSGWLFWNDKIKYFCKTQEDGCKDTLYKCDMCWGGDREIEHLPNTKMLYKCENVIGEEAHAVEAYDLVWLDKEKMWVCKGCILGTSGYTCNQVPDLDLYSFQNFIDESVQW